MCICFVLNTDMMQKHKFTAFRYRCTSISHCVFICVRINTHTHTHAYPFKAYWLRDSSKRLTLNNCTPCPHCIYVSCIYLRTNSDLCHLQRKLIGLYNRDEKCLQRGTDWVFK